MLHENTNETMMVKEMLVEKKPKGERRTCNITTACAENHA
jgi:hypothetical protein